MSRPDEDPNVEWLPAISTAARLVDLDRLYDPDRPDEPESDFVLKARPEHLEAYVEWVIEQRIKEGKLVRADPEDDIDDHR